MEKFRDSTFLSSAHDTISSSIDHLYNGFQDSKQFGKFLKASFAASAYSMLSPEYHQGIENYALNFAHIANSFLQTSMGLFAHSDLQQLSQIDRRLPLRSQGDSPVENIQSYFGTLSDAYIGKGWFTNNLLTIGTTYFSFLLGQSTVWGVNAAENIIGEVEDAIRNGTQAQWDSLYQIAEAGIWVLIVEQGIQFVRTAEKACSDHQHRYAAKNLTDLTRETIASEQVLNNLTYDKSLANIDMSQAVGESGAQIPGQFKGLYRGLIVSGSALWAVNQGLASRSQSIGFLDEWGQKANDSIRDYIDAPLTNAFNYATSYGMNFLPDQSGITDHINLVPGENGTLVLAYTAIGAFLVFYNKYAKKFDQPLLDVNDFRQETKGVWRTELSRLQDQGALVTASKSEKLLAHRMEGQYKNLNTGWSRETNVRLGYDAFTDVVTQVRTAMSHVIGGGSLLLSNAFTFATAKAQTDLIERAAIHSSWFMNVKPGFMALKNDLDRFLVPVRALHKAYVPEFNNNHSPPDQPRVIRQGNALYQETPTDSIVIENGRISAPNEDGEEKVLYTMPERVEISQEDCVLIEGSNGCGKSRLIHSLFWGMWPYTEGTFHLPSKQDIYFATQDVYMPRGLKLCQQIMVGADLEMLTKLYEEDALYDKICDLMEMVGLDDMIEDHFHTVDCQLSGGQRQAVAVARAILQQPKFALWDEPCAAMDEKATRRFFHLIKTQLPNTGHVMVMHGHDMSKEITEYNERMTADKPLLQAELRKQMALHPPPKPIGYDLFNKILRINKAEKNAVFIDAKEPEVPMPKHEQPGELVQLPTAISKTGPEIMPPREETEPSVAETDDIRSAGAPIVQP